MHAYKRSALCFALHLLSFKMAMIPIPPRYVEPTPPSVPKEKEKEKEKEEEERREPTPPNSQT
jgi:hypothetical protein